MKTYISVINWLQLIALTFLTFSCNQTQSTDAIPYEESVRRKAMEYFETYAERTDWDKFCSFYGEDLYFKDIMLQFDLDSLWKFKRFYNWEGEKDRFSKLSPEQKHLELQSLVVEGNTVAARGNFNPYYYDGVLIDSEWGMEFTIWLRFDSNLKIVEQIDWIEYDPYVLESTIKRCREEGFGKIPSWLDLSKEE